jgi:HK97 family phage prohead protease
MNKQFKFPEAQAKDFNDDERSFVATASDEGVDRDGEAILSEGWDLKNYKSNPVVMLAHNYMMGGRESLPVGKAEWVKTKDKKLIFKPTFAPTELGQEIYTLYKGGFLNAFSVGFIPREWEDSNGDGIKKPKRICKRAELLEISVVAVPSNPRALVDAKAKGFIKTKELSAIVDEVEAQGDPTKTVDDETIGDESTITISQKTDWEAIIKQLTARIDELEAKRVEPIVEKVDAVAKQEVKVPDHKPLAEAFVDAITNPIKIDYKALTRDAIRFELDVKKGIVR